MASSYDVASLFIIDSRMNGEHLRAIIHPLNGTPPSQPIQVSTQSESSNDSTGTQSPISQSSGSYSSSLEAPSPEALEVPSPEAQPTNAERGNMFRLSTQARSMSIRNNNISQNIPLPLPNGNDISVQNTETQLYLAVHPKKSNIYLLHKIQSIIHVYDGECRFKKSIGGHGQDDGQFVMPSGIAFDSSSRIVVIDSGNYRIQILGDNGRHIQTLALPLSKLNGVATFEDKIYTIDNNETLYVYRQNLQLDRKRRLHRDNTSLFFNDLIVNESGIYIAQSDSSRHLMQAKVRRYNTNTLIEESIFSDTSEAPVYNPIGVFLHRNDYLLIADKPRSQMEPRIRVYEIERNAANAVVHIGDLANGVDVSMNAIATLRNGTVVIATHSDSPYSDGPRDLMRILPEETLGAIIYDREEEGVFHQD